MGEVGTYFDSLLRAVNQCEWVFQKDLSFRQIDEAEVYIKGDLTLYGGFVLHIAEYTVIREDGIARRIKYRYQLQNQDADLICRWDNAPHHPRIPTHPFHKHLKDDGISSSEEMSLDRILRELDRILTDI